MRLRALGDGLHQTVRPNRCTLLGAKNSRLQNNQDVDTSEITVATPERTAYDLWLTEKFKKRIYKPGGFDVWSARAVH